MSYVTISHFQDRYENSIPYGDNTRLQAMLDDACAMASDITGTAYDDGDTVPGAIVATVCAAVRRAYDNPGGLQGETIGDYSWRAATSGSGSGVYFTREEERIMRRSVGGSTAGSVELEGMLPATTNDAQYIGVNGGGESVLYFAVEDLP